jgi:ABC-2 type transport system permease protein
VRPLGLALPTTYWLELIRRALLGDATLHASPSLATWSDTQVLTFLAALTVALGVAGVAMFNLCAAIARQRGLIDRTNSY